MKKKFNLMLLAILLNGCAESMALLGPASTSLAGGNMAQSASSSLISYSIKKKTGKSPMEHAITYVEKNNPERKESKWVSISKISETETYEILKKNISQTKIRS